MHYCRPSQFVAVESVSSFCSTCDEPVGRSIPTVGGRYTYVCGWWAFWCRRRDFSIVEQYLLAEIRMRDNNRGQVEVRSSISMHSLCLPGS